MRFFHELSNVLRLSLILTVHRDESVLYANISLFAYNIALRPLRGTDAYQWQLPVCAPYSVAAKTLTYLVFTRNSRQISALTIRGIKRPLFPGIIRMIDRL